MGNWIQRISQILLLLSLPNVLIAQETVLGTKLSDILPLECEEVGTSRAETVDIVLKRDASGWKFGGEYGLVNLREAGEGFIFEGTTEHASLGVIKKSTNVDSWSIEILTSETYMRLQCKDKRELVKQLIGILEEGAELDRRLLVVAVEEAEDEIRELKEEKASLLSRIEKLNEYKAASLEEQRGIAVLKNAILIGAFEGSLGYTPSDTDPLIYRFTTEARPHCVEAFLNRLKNMGTFCTTNLSDNLLQKQ